MKYSIRSQFVSSKDNVLVEMDFSQAEAWIVAYLADEKNMKHSLLHSDIHRDTACVIFDLPADRITTEMRYIGKRQNHANNYGQGPERSTEVINKDSDKPPYVTITLRDAKQFRNKWLAHYTGITNWWTSIQEQLRATRTLTTPYKRTRSFFAPWGNDLFKEAYAYIPQSTVADHCMGRVCSALGIHGGVRMVFDKFVKGKSILKILNQSHDSIIMDIPKSSYISLVPEIKQLMERPLVIRNETFTIPVDVKIGERWGELEKYKC